MAAAVERRVEAGCAVEDDTETAVAGVRRVAAQLSKDALALLEDSSGGAVRGRSMDVSGSDSSSRSSLLSGSRREKSKREEWKDRSSSFRGGLLLPVLTLAVVFASCGFSSWRDSLVITREKTDAWRRGRL